MNPRASHLRLIGPVTLSLALLVTGCAGLGSLGDRFGAPTPRERYAESLESAGLTATEMGRAWISAGERAVAEAVAAEAPFAEVLYFDPATPSAAAFRVELRRGQKLELRLASPQGAPLPFVELLGASAEAGEARRTLALEGEAPRWEHAPDADGEVVVLVQPELLSGGVFELEARLLGTLAFPVEGHGREAVGSVFGDPRDGGSRRHEGVDIFAPRGTPAVAAADGVVARVGTNRLGGNVVWLRAGGRSLYYAHLEEATVESGARVRAGDPVGRVGNSGNARGTPPHLHFGVYAGGAVDPLRFFDPADVDPSPVTADREPLGAWGRVATSRARLRAGPSTGDAIVDELPRGTALELAGARRDWYRARLPDGEVGYVAARLVEPALEPLDELRVERARPLRRRPAPAGAVVAEAPAGGSLPVLARFGAELLVRSADGRALWLGDAATRGVDS